MQNEAEAKAQRRAEVDQLLAEQTAVEEHFLDNYIQTIRDYQMQLRELRLQDVDSFNDLKLKYASSEKEVQVFVLGASYSINSMRPAVIY